MFKTLFEIHKKPKYSLITFIVFVIVMAIALTVSNIRFLVDVFQIFGFTAGVQSFVSLLGSIATNFTVLSATYIILLAILFGINVSLFVFYIDKFKKMKEGAGIKSSTGGLIIGALGIGCASCGSLILVPILSVVGLGGVLAFLPFGGQEFAIIGLLLLAYSTREILKKIKGPVTCSVS